METIRLYFLLRMDTVDTMDAIDSMDTIWRRNSGAKL